MYVLKITLHNSPDGCDGLRKEQIKRLNMLWMATVRPYSQSVRHKCSFLLSSIWFFSLSFASRYSHRSYAIDLNDKMVSSERTAKRIKETMCRVTHEEDRRRRPWRPCAQERRQKPTIKRKRIKYVSKRKHTILWGIQQWRCRLERLRRRRPYQAKYHIIVVFTRCHQFRNNRKEVM